MTNANLTSDHQTVAVLIDADNTQLSKLESVLEEIAVYGRISVKRAYGNWTKQFLINWPEALKRLAIKAEQQFDYVAGKNATDMALVIDAMELLYTDKYDTFVIVSSDSDFTPLAIKIREYGARVIGIGERKTSDSFRKACDEFWLIENLGENKASQTKNNCPCQETNNSVEQDLEIVHQLLLKAWLHHQNDDGWVNVCSANQYIRRAKPDFDPRSYGFTKLPELLLNFPDLYKVERFSGKGGVTIVAYKCAY